MLNSQQWLICAIFYGGSAKTWLKSVTSGWFKLFYFFVSVNSAFGYECKSGSAFKWERAAWTWHGIEYCVRVFRKFELAIAHVENRTSYFTKYHIGWTGPEFIGWHTQWPTAFTAAAWLYKNNRPVLSAECMNQVDGRWCGRNAFCHSLLSWSW